MSRLVAPFLQYQGFGVILGKSVLGLLLLFTATSILLIPMSTHADNQAYEKGNFPGALAHTSASPTTLQEGDPSGLIMREEPDWPVVSGRVAGYFHLINLGHQTVTKRFFLGTLLSHTIIIPRRSRTTIQRLFLLSPGATITLAPRESRGVAFLTTNTWIGCDCTTHKPISYPSFRFQAFVALFNPGEEPTFQKNSDGRDVPEQYTPSQNENVPSSTIPFLSKSTSITTFSTSMKLVNDPRHNTACGITSSLVHPPDILSLEKLPDTWGRNTPTQ